MGTPAEVSQLLQHNLERLEARITDACQRAGRSRSEVTLVGITKYVDLETTQALHASGLQDLGESRPQALWEKAPSIPTARWHLVGHLQRNKVARTLPLVHLIHSVDSLRLMQALDEEAGKQNRTQDILLELHLTQEATKNGFAEEEWEQLPHHADLCRHLRVVGLMGMAALEGSLDDARSTFARMRELRDRWRSFFSPPHDLRHLSMGMTGDFVEAILEGATHIRIGSALFEGIQHGK